MPFGVTSEGTCQINGSRADANRVCLCTAKSGHTGPHLCGAISIIANRGSLETVIPAVPEEACGIVCGDAAECRTDRCMQGVDRARTDLGNSDLNLAQAGSIGLRSGLSGGR